MSHPFFTTHSDYQTPIEFLQGRSGPKDRPLMAVSETETTILRWDTWPTSNLPMELILATTLEIPGPSTKELLVYLGETGPKIASLEVNYSDPYQILSIPLPSGPLPTSGPLALRLQLGSGERLWLFAPDQTASDGLEFHTPHLAVSSGKADNFLDRLCSLASLQTFSWKEGCILDGLQALAQTGRHPEAASAIREHLNYFGYDSGNLVYESPNSHRLVNEFTTIETTLPFAHIAALNIQHPWIQLATDYWQKLLDTNGQVHDHDLISSEGAYTVAYPMTAIGVMLGEPRWVEIAESLLIKTGEHLILPEGIYLRHWLDGRLTHRNWARGLAWLLLGHAQTLRHQPHPSQRLQTQLQTIADFAARHQLENGLWACFVDEPQVAPDCAGSAGIAAAMALAASAGFLPSEFRDRAERGRLGLHGRLTSEGFLEGCSQSNKGGEDLQRGPYRVITPYALGLLGLLEAALESSH